tara:strand:+ start:956 stop:1159 length:204 start_codon:yes stop_codon:yes gene_type:complete
MVSIHNIKNYPVVLHLDVTIGFGLAFSHVNKFAFIRRILSLALSARLPSFVTTQVFNLLIFEFKLFL